MPNHVSYIKDIIIIKFMDRINDWALAIKKHEGWFRGSASYRNNNPGNFRCYPLVMGEFGATGCKNNLAIFPNYEKGWNALKQFLIYACTNKLKSYKSTMTLLEFYGKYAPGSDGNNPKNYASAVAKDLGVGIDTKIKDLYIPESTQTPPESTQNYTIYSQKDSRWKNIKLGFGKYTIGSDGCFLTCLSMMVNKAPDVVNEILKKAGAFSGSLIISDKAAKALGLQLLKGNSNIPGKMTNINYMPDWSPSIKEVDYNSKTANKEQHFVLRIIEDGKRFIIDPLGGIKREINYYRFLSYRLFIKK